MKKKGLTLLEVLIATILFSLVISGLANIFVAAKRLLLHAHSRVIAAELAKYQIERMHAQVREDQWSTNCLGSNTNCTPANGFLTTYTDSSQTTYLFTWDATNQPAIGVRRVNLTIQWYERSAQ